MLRPCHWPNAWMAILCSFDNIPYWFAAVRASWMIFIKLFEACRISSYSCFYQISCWAFRWREIRCWGIHILMPGMGILCCKHFRHARRQLYVPEGAFIRQPWASSSSSYRIIISLASHRHSYFKHILITSQISSLIYINVSSLLIKKLAHFGATWWVAMPNVAFSY